MQNIDIMENDSEQPSEIQQLRDQQLAQTMDFKKTHIDPAPFQLVERTSLYKVWQTGLGILIRAHYTPSLQIHSLFSILALSHAYVTSIGRLVGVVTLHDVSSFCG